MESRSFERIEVYAGTGSELERVDPAERGLDVEYIEQEKTPADYARALFDGLWETGKLSSDAYMELLQTSYAYGVTLDGERYYLGACRNFDVAER